MPDYVVTYKSGPALWGSVMLEADDENTAALVACGYVAAFGSEVTEIESVERVTE